MSNAIFDEINHCSRCGRTHLNCSCTLVERAAEVIKDGSWLSMHSFLCHGGTSCAANPASCTAQATKEAVDALNTAHLVIKEQLALQEATQRAIQSLKDQFKTKVSYIKLTNTIVAFNDDVTMKKLVKDLANNIVQGLSDMLSRHEK